jgi:hypothetical protein
MKKFINKESRPAKPICLYLFTLNISAFFFVQREGRRSSAFYKAKELQLTGGKYEVGVKNFK